MEFDKNILYISKVALKGMLLQAKQLPRFWKLSKLDGMVWMVTVVTVVLVGIDVGLLAGLLTSLASILLLTIEPYTCLLGHVTNTDLYLDVNRYNGVSLHSQKFSKNRENSLQSLLMLLHRRRNSVGLKYFTTAAA